MIVDVLDAFAARVPPAIDNTDDLVQRTAAAFRAYCEVIDEHRHAAVLTYRESRTFGPEGREKIKKLEVDTSEPLRTALRAGARSGHFTDVDMDLVAHDLLLIAHGWALKHWYFEQHLSFDDYVRNQTTLVLRAILSPEHREQYRELIGGV